MNRIIGFPVYLGRDGSILSPRADLEYLPLMTEHAEPTHRERLQWLDYLKGLGIVLVVIGHVYTYGFAAKVIFLFHMPLFFVISGFTHRPQPVLAFLWKTTLSLALPYIAYLLLISAGDIHRLLLTNSTSDGLVAVVDLLQKRAYGGVRLVKEFGVFWFVSVLYLGLNLLNLILRVGGQSSRVLWVAMIACAGLAIADDLLLQPVAVPLNANVVPAAVFFLLAGVLCRDSLSVSKAIPLVGCLAICVLSVYLIMLEPREMQLVMKKANYGWFGVGLIIALAWVYCLFWLARQLTRLRVLPNLFLPLGAASFVIMFLHQSVHFFMVDNTDSLSRALVVSAALLFSYGFYALAKDLPLVSRVFVGR